MADRMTSVNMSEEESCGHDQRVPTRESRVQSCPINRTAGEQAADIDLVTRSSVQTLMCRGREFWFGNRLQATARRFVATPSHVRQQNPRIAASSEGQFQKW
jgi:hypothetical protein